MNSKEGHYLEGSHILHVGAAQSTEETANVIGAFIKAHQKLRDDARFVVNGVISACPSCGGIRELDKTTIVCKGKCGFRQEAEMNESL